MNCLARTGFFATAAALALGALVAAPAVHAGSDVSVTVGVQGPSVHVHPAPVYVHPAPVHVQPRPVYILPRPVLPAPQIVFGPEPGQHDHHADHEDRKHEKHRGKHKDKHAKKHRGAHGDRDGDGVRNRDDRSPDHPHRH